MAAETTTTTRPRLTADQRADQLLDSAGELFVTKGYERTSIEDIARAAGVTRPVVYQHHGSKEGVLLAWVARTRGELMEGYRVALQGIDEPRAALAAVADVWFASIEGDPRRWELLYGGGVHALGPGWEEQLTTLPSNLDFYVRGIQRWSASDVGLHQVEAFAHMVLGAGVELGRWWIANPQVPRHDVVDRYVAFCWAALEPLRPPTDPPIRSVAR